MTILGIETSCDETGAAMLKQSDNRVTILSNIVASSAKLQAKYGGIIPEQAAREQIKSIVPVIKEALIQSNLYPLSSKNHLLSPAIHPPAIDAIAVTQGPGLIGSLLVGVETAKALSLVWQKPLIPVNHLLGHFYANWIVRGDSEESSQNVPQALIRRQADTESRSGFEILKLQDPELPTFPCLGLLVSGGHTDLVLFKNHDKYIYLGGTRDDAAGECFDKSARLIGYPYPGGPKISKIAQKGNPKAFKLPRPMLGSNDLDFSFSGLKTAFANLVAKNFNVTSIDPEDAQLHWRRIVLEESKLAEQEQILADMCASIEETIIKHLIDKTIKAAQITKVKQIMVAGGVAANQKLVMQLQNSLSHEPRAIRLFVPPPHLCTDNAAMIAARAFFQNPIKNLLRLQANSSLSF